jgi:ubiquitin-conjugating enzyme E2 J2
MKQYFCPAAQPNEAPFLISDSQMATKAAHKRLMKEYAAIQTSPPPFIVAKPIEKNILEWYARELSARLMHACRHYVITGPPDSPYTGSLSTGCSAYEWLGGEYHGKLVFPSEYPFKVRSTAGLNSLCSRPQSK